MGITNYELRITNYEWGMGNGEWGMGENNYYAVMLWIDPNT
ncbi:hypothetical protein [Planktothrix paucivesiculata]|nr:hypothetical protein [Planktothrix paucivesiculata]